MFGQVMTHLGNNLKLNQENNMSKGPLLNVISLKNGDSIYVLGTAHVSSRSVEDVRKTAEEYNVDAICVEIDADRLSNMLEQKKWRESDITTILKRKQGFLLLVNLALASFQKRIGEEQGISPGSEMKEAVLLAKEMNITPTLADRKVSVTLRRVWRMSSFWQKIKLLASLLVGVKDEKISPEEIENLKNNDLLSQMMQELAKEFPSIKNVLIDERDLYLAYHIYHTSGKRRLAVVGAGHMQGIEKYIYELENGKETDIHSLEQVPPPTIAAKITPYIISFLLLLIIVVTAVQQESKHQSIEVIMTWIISNSIPALIGGIIALAHPLTLLSAIILSPITAFIPLLSTGLIAALLQAVIRKPKAEDFENISTDFNKRRFYKNRVLNTLLIFILINIGSSAGAFLGFFNILNRI